MSKLTYNLFSYHRQIILSTSWRIAEVLRREVKLLTYYLYLKKMTPEETLEKLKVLGLNEQKAKETLKNVNVTRTLLTAIKEVDVKNKPPGTGMLLYHMATKIKPQLHFRLPFICKYIGEGQLDSVLRVEAALEYLLSHINNPNIDISAFERACGIGVVISPEEIEQVVEKYVAKYKSELLDKRYRFNTGLIMQGVRFELPWADGKAVKNELDVQMLDLLGPKSEGDLIPLPKIKGGANKSKQQDAKGAKQDNSDVDEATTIAELMKKLSFHAPGENYKTDGYVVTPKTKQLLEEHLKLTGGKVRTRFPPEPNGILHIGHAKAININFGYAAAHDGVCFLRYDDTNPEKEEEKFFIGIRDMVEWLGYKPYKITHSSDYFEQLYEWAVQLIKDDLAYVCHQKSEEIKGFNPPPSPWRNRPIEESLQLFEDMKNGKIDEGDATLRMKITLEEGKQDPVAYRIRFKPHHRTGSKWCIYPTYDYTHCLCDSIENITHSLCTKEFQSRRSSYYWLCNALGIYCPVQWEYGRLNVNYTVVSKRKIAKLIEEGIVNDWDDPRLYTLSALRRRGVPAAAVSAFCAALGVTSALCAVDPAMLDAVVRDELNVTAPRTMVVLNPLKVSIMDFPAENPITLIVSDFPGAQDRGMHNVTFNKIIYIEATDFKEKPESGYRRLTTKQCVGLRYAGYILWVVKVFKDDEGKIIELLCSSEIVDPAEKPKAFIHWVSDPVSVEVRLYDPLFKHRNPEDPNDVPGGFLSDCRKDTMKVVNAYADASILGAKVYDKFQFERVGFFSVDPDTTDSRMVFNRTVSLKEDIGK